MRVSGLSSNPDDLATHKKGPGENRGLCYAVMIRCVAKARAASPRRLGGFSSLLDQLPLELTMAAGRHETALALTERAAKQHGEAAPIAEFRAAALDELQRVGDAALLFERLGSPGSVDLAVRRIRHLLAQRGFRLSSARCRTLAGDRRGEPGVALGWRLKNDRNSAWLEDQAGLVRQFDFDPDTIGIAALTARLRGIHAHSGRFLYQSSG